MISKVLLRFLKQPIRMVPVTKVLLNPKLKVKTPKLSLPVHSYIVYKHYTGNEILYSLKDYEKLKPGEISSGLLELGLRRGVSKDFDWSSHPVIKKVIAHVKERIPQYTCRVLTSLAHAFNRLKVKDEEIWKLLATHVTRTITTIDQAGISYSFKAFAGKNFKEFFDGLIEILPIYIGQMDPKEFINVVTGISMENILDENLFVRHLDPYITERIDEFSVSQVKEYLEACNFRKENCKELTETLENWIEKKLNKAKRVSFGAGVEPKVKKNQKTDAKNTDEDK